ncbi:MAG: hypothetical protein TQ35_0000805 [Candidatus Aramenus sulfurataquae]|uniref:Uncharacterized protein n=1 Tax=Candidatus Aramenus sulfurataquae TaxID=1326980 RepID=A0ACC6TLL2_9CREN
MKSAGANGLGLLTRRIEIILTSSRDASARTRSFLNELEIIIPNSLKINRGRRSLDEVFSLAYRLGASSVLLVLTDKGNPSKLELYSISHNIVNLEYKLKIESLSLISDVKLKKAPRLPCIDKFECTELTGFLSSLNLLRFSKCRSFMDLLKQGSSCEIIFKDLKGEKLNPKMRLSICST